MILSVPSIHRGGENARHQAGTADANGGLEGSPRQRVSLVGAWGQRHQQAVPVYTGTLLATNAPTYFPVQKMACLAVLHVEFPDVFHNLIKRDTS